MHLFKPTVFCLLICRDLGYDSDEGGKGGRGTSGGAKKALSVQDQMVCLFFHFFIVPLFFVVCLARLFSSACGVKTFLQHHICTLPCLYFSYIHLSCNTFMYQQKADLAALMLQDDSPLATVEDYWTIQPRRTEMIMKWLHEPFLKNALEGFYVRFAIGKESWV